MTQSEMILTHLKRHGSITPQEAMREYGCMRLGARIYDLRQQGHEIQRDMVQAENRFGVKVSFARYFLTGKGE